MAVYEPFGRETQQPLATFQLSVSVSQSVCLSLSISLAKRCVGFRQHGYHPNDSRRVALDVADVLLRTHQAIRQLPEGDKWLTDRFAEEDRHPATIRRLSALCLSQSV